MASYLITGCSRGLGLALAAQLASFPKSEVGTIFATARTESPALKQLVDSSSGRVIWVPLDVTNETSIQEAVEQLKNVLKGEGLDVLINNAGKTDWCTNGIETMTPASLTEILTSNVVGVQLVTSAFLGLVRTSARKMVVNITSTLGSITDAAKFTQALSPAYKISKAALNALTVQYALSYAHEGLTFYAISPGWLLTDLGGEHAHLSVTEGAIAVVKDIMKSGVDQNGEFHNVHVPGWEKLDGINMYDGLNRPW